VTSASSSARTDEEEIRDVCLRSWAGFDRKDINLFLAAFTANAMMSLFGGSQVVEIGAIAAGGELVTPFEHSSHAPANQVITVERDTAVADTLVVAHVVVPGCPVAVRGLRYLDDLIRTDQGWRINGRQHHVLWQYDVDRVQPHVPSEA
jgi:SnoaL-like domain